MKRRTLSEEEVQEQQERLEARREQLAADRKAAASLLATDDGARLIRYLRAAWCTRGLGSTPERTAFRVARRDAVEELEELRDEAGR